MVQRRIAQVATRKMSELPPSGGEPNTPLLSASEEIKKPISPRATIALPSINDGYSDCGFGSFRATCLLRFELADGVCPLPEAEAGVGVSVIC